jgi:hypothetical protein
VSHPLTAPSGVSESKQGEHQGEHQHGRLSRFVHENSLSLTLLLFFLLVLVGQILTGWSVFNEELSDHGKAPLDLTTYLTSGHFLEALFENWESEFLQMGLFVVLTIGLRQKGSSESKPLEGEDSSDEEPREHQHDPQAPWPVRRGGAWLFVYEHSLSIALFALFIASFSLHGVAGLREYNAERALQGQGPVDLLHYVGSSTFWFQSFQNWQSEFLSVFAMIVLSIFLRQRGSPQSKPVAAPHGKTGE